MAIAVRSSPRISISIWGGVMPRISKQTLEERGCVKSLRLEPLRPGALLHRREPEPKAAIRR